MSYLDLQAIQESLFTSKPLKMAWSPKDALAQLWTFLWYHKRLVEYCSSCIGWCKLLPRRGSKSTREMKVEARSNGFDHRSFSGCVWLRKVWAMGQMRRIVISCSVYPEAAPIITQRPLKLSACSPPPQHSLPCQSKRRIQYCVGKVDCSERNSVPAVRLGRPRRSQYLKPHKQSSVETRSGWNRNSLLEASLSRRADSLGPDHKDLKISLEIMAKLS